jgi:hypothetical protein
MDSNIWRPEAPASEESLKRLAEQAGFHVPDSYLSQLRYSNGGEGDLAVDPGWISLWRAEDVISQNSAYEVPELVPGLWGFGSNGGGELLAFDLRGGEPYRGTPSEGSFHATFLPAKPIPGYEPSTPGPSRFRLHDYPSLL